MIMMKEKNLLINFYLDENYDIWAEGQNNDEPVLVAKNVKTSLEFKKIVNKIIDRIYDSIELKN